MLIVRKSNARGQTTTDWLQSFHTFSFADYYDPKFLGFGHLLVINEDTVAPASGFGMHSHRDMEIISYVVEGAIQHTDSLGQSQTLKPGEIQRMSAGQGVRHSEINPSSTDKLHFLQIWIIPRETGLPASYEQKKIPQHKNDLILIGSSDQIKDGVTIHQDVNLYVSYLEKGNSVAYSFDENNYAWLQLIKGSVLLNNETVLYAGDGVAIMEEDKITINSLDTAEFLFFDFKNEKNEKLYEENSK